ncbi:MAG: peptidylprolyl isomerase [Rhodospirillales bacterium]|nr:peptidylprolyl isomerase [Rhodospirillales bacterium]
MIRFFARFLVALVAAATVMTGSLAMAQDQVVAKVNGKSITEGDMRLADAEIGNELGTLPPDQRRRVLLEYLIENQLFAEAAEGEKLASGAQFDERMQYWRRRALRDSYFERSVKSSVDDREARKLYDQQVSGIKPEEEVRARHILVDGEDKAREVYEKIAHGEDFSKMAKEHSKDPGSKDDGGDLGYFAKGQMVPEFETAAFKLKKGDVSMPVQTKFGWHLIKIEDRRARGAPPFEQVKERILASLVHRKAQEVAAGLAKRPNSSTSTPRSRSRSTARTP